jgi:hypothetical protein
VFCADCLKYLIQIKAEVKEVDELKQYQPVYKFNFSEKHKIIELKICRDCFQDLTQKFISENRLKEKQEDKMPLRTGLEVSQVNFQEDSNDNIQNVKETKEKSRFFGFF